MYIGISTSIQIYGRHLLIKGTFTEIPSQDMS